MHTWLLKTRGRYIYSGRLHVPEATNGKVELFSVSTAMYDAPEEFAVTWSRPYRKRT